MSVKLICILRAAFVVFVVLYVSRRTRFVLCLIIIDRVLLRNGNSNFFLDVYCVFSKLLQIVFVFKCSARVRFPIKRILERFSNGLRSFWFLIDDTFEEELYRFKNNIVSSSLATTVGWKKFRGKHNTRGFFPREYKMSNKIFYRFFRGIPYWDVHFLKFL